MTTWGESHGEAIGVVVDGCPAGIELSLEEIQKALDRRRPGKNRFTSPRKEADQAKIVSGLFEGKTTGAPISILIPNLDADPSQYDAVKNHYRPGHANYTYLKKYGIFDHRGGGRASARETAARVAAGAIASKLINVQVTGFLKQIGDIIVKEWDQEVNESPIFCPDSKAEKEMIQLIDQMRDEGDSVGGIVGIQTSPLPIGFGEPVYEKLEAELAYAMLSIPASKGIEFGAGMLSSQMSGSTHNDCLDETGTFTTNHCGGTLGGISNGMPLEFRVSFKPTSSIKKVQMTQTLSGESSQMKLPKSARHDPCIAIRAVPVVEAMTSIVLADAFLKMSVYKNNLSD
ncbi:MAG: chorismate synthase [Simkaniaceae bacterium]|nr:chorismate synthase [Simkaniaceae bacterium]